MWDHFSHASLNSCPQCPSTQHRCVQPLLSLLPWSIYTCFVCQLHTFTNDLECLSGPVVCALIMLNHHIEGLLNEQFFLKRAASFLSVYSVPKSNEKHEVYKIPLLSLRHQKNAVGRPSPSESCHNWTCECTFILCHNLSIIQSLFSYNTCGFLLYIYIYKKIIENTRRSVRNRRKKILMITHAIQMQNYTFLMANF